MIILRQKEFSSNWLKDAKLICPICSEKCDVQEEGVNNFPIQIFKQILKNWKTNIIKEISEYEKSASKITEKPATEQPVVPEQPAGPAQPSHGRGG